MSYYNNNHNKAATVQQGARLNKVYGNNAQSLELVKVGGISRTNTIVRRQQEREAIEQHFMNISFKAARGEANRVKRAAWASK